MAVKKKTTLLQPAFDLSAHAFICVPLSEISAQLRTESPAHEFTTKGNIFWGKTDVWEHAQPACERAVSTF